MNLIKTYKHKHLLLTTDHPHLPSLLVRIEFSLFMNTKWLHIPSHT
uniref:Uncharacterized protein n=1 Tax=Rhizophora mucronata TaxID=61149 RepID=A0A2P2PTP1_RHIMU